MKLSKEKPHQLEKDTLGNIKKLKDKGIRHFDDAEDLQKKGIHGMNDYNQMIKQNAQSDLNALRISESKSNKKETAWNKKNFSAAIEYAENTKASWQKNVFDIKNKQSALSQEYNDLDANPTTDPDELKRIEERLDQIIEERKQIDRDLAKAENFLTIHKIEKVGLERMKHAKENPTVIDNVYGEHMGNDGTKSGEQRRKGKTQKSEARVNFENTLKQVGDLQTQYLTAYENHFKNMSEKQLKRNRMLESLGVRQGDKVKALKTEREKYESAKASLLDNLKNDLMKSRIIERPDGSKLEKEGLHPDQAERVAAKYVEKVLNIASIQQEEKKLETAKEEAFKNQIAAEVAHAKKLETATRMEKVGMYFKRNWKFKLTMLGIGLTTTAATGGVAGLYLLRRVAGMAGGLVGAEFGKYVGGGIGKSLYGKEGRFGAKKFDTITTEYLEGKISITEYQKRLEKMGLNEKRVKAVLAVAGGVGGGLGFSWAEGQIAGPVHPDDVDTTSVNGKEIPKADPDENTSGVETALETDKPSKWQQLTSWVKSIGDSKKDDIHEYQPIESNDVHDGLKEAADAKHVDQPVTEHVTGSTQTAPIEDAEKVASATEKTTTPSTGKIFESVAEKGDGGIRLTEKLQAELREAYPDMDSAPKAVQDFVNTDAEKLMVQEKLLSYKDGVASSGMVHIGDKLVLDPDTGELELVSAKGDVISTLEDGDATTDEAFTGKMVEHSTAPSTEEVSIDRGDLSATWDNGTGAEGESTISIEREGTPLEETAESSASSNTPDDTDHGAENTAEKIGEKLDEKKIDPSAALEKTSLLKVDTAGYDPDVITIAENYALDLSESAQANFLKEYDTAVRSIFSTTVEGKSIDNVYESPSLWDTYKDKTFGELVGSLERKLTMSKFERGLYDYLTKGSAVKLQILDTIGNNAPNVKLADVIAVVEKNS